VDGQLAGMLFFMAMPYVVVFGIGGGLLIAHRRSRPAEHRQVEGE
jgi:hypothetical protein